MNSHLKKDYINMIKEQEEERDKQIQDQLSRTKQVYRNVDILVKSPKLGKWGKEQRERNKMIKITK